MRYARLASTLVFAGSVALIGSLLDGSLVAQQKEIAYESAGDFLKLPDDIHLGEVAGGIEREFALLGEQRAGEKRSGEEQRGCEA